MKKKDLVVSIISFFRENKHLKNVYLSFKSPLCLHSSEDGSTTLLIEKYYEYDVTISEYKNSKRVSISQECYDDLPIKVLEQIYDKIQKYSEEIKLNLDIINVSEKVNTDAKPSGVDVDTSSLTIN